MNGNQHGFWTESEPNSASTTGVNLTPSWEKNKMSGICSAHRDHRKGCPTCEAIPYPAHESVNLAISLEHAEKIAKFLGVVQEDYRWDLNGDTLRNFAYDCIQNIDDFGQWLRSDSGTVAMILKFHKKGSSVTHWPIVSGIHVQINVPVGEDIKNVRMGQGDTLNTALINACLGVIENGY